MDRQLIKNIFTDVERKHLLKHAIPCLMSGDELSKRSSSGGFFPGKQTDGNLHHIPVFIPAHNIFLRRIREDIGIHCIILKSWVNLTNGYKKDIGWHTHNADLSAVYYIKTPLPFFSNGTLFRDGLFKAPQNSLLVFPSRFEHTAPSSPFRFNRYTLAMDLAYG